MVSNDNDKGYVSDCVEILICSTKLHCIILFNTRIGKYSHESNSIRLSYSRYSEYIQICVI